MHCAVCAYTFTIHLLPGSSKVESFLGFKSLSMLLCGYVDMYTCEYVDNGHVNMWL